MECANSEGNVGWHLKNDAWIEVFCVPEGKRSVIESSQDQARSALLKSSSLRIERGGRFAEGDVSGDDQSDLGSGGCRAGESKIGPDSDSPLAHAL